MTLKPKIASYIVDIVSTLQDAGYEAYIVGGAVRDFLLDRQPKDYDISTSATPEEVKKVFRKNHVLIIGRRFRLVHFFHGREIIEISTFRRKPELSQTEVKPAKIKDAPENMIFRDNEYGTVREDAERRDFTVNALFYDPVNDKILDFTGSGLDDIRNGIVRAIGCPRVRFEEDPVRILRALKLVGQYGFRFDPETDAALRETMPLIRLASDSRMTLETEKILKNPYGDRILETFHRYGFLQYFLPELEADWETSDAEYIRELWRARNERIRSGEYRESISLALSLLILPYAEKRFRELGNGRFGGEFHDELEDAVSAVLKPRTPTRRAIAAAVRTILLQPKFAEADPSVMEKVRQHPGYAHARELAFIRNSVHPFRNDFETVWPVSHREFRQGPRRFHGGRGGRGGRGGTPS